MNQRDDKTLAAVDAYARGLEDGRAEARREAASAGGVVAPLSFDVPGLRVDLNDLTPGPDALAREDAARDVARAWVESGEPLSRESAGALMAALDRLAAAYGLS